MKLFRKKRYYFSDDSIAVDTIIAFVMAVISLIIEVTGVVFSFVTKGHVPEIFGILYLCAIIMSVNGVIFAALGYKSEEGGLKSKWFSMVLNLISLAVIGSIFLLGIK